MKRILLFMIFIFSTINNLNSEERKSLIGPYLGLRGTYSNFYMEFDKIGINLDFGGIYYFPLKNLNDFGVIINAEYSTYSFGHQLDSWDADVSGIDNVRVDYSSSYLKIGGALDYMNIYAGVNICLPNTSSVDFTGLPEEIASIVRENVNNPKTTLTIEPFAGYRYPVYYSGKNTLFVFGTGSYILDDFQTFSLNVGAVYMFGM